MADKQPLDIDEQQAMTKAMGLMVQQCPVVTKRGITVRIEDVTPKPNVIGLFPTQGAVYVSKYISGAFEAQYPFRLMYRVKPGSDDSKITAGDVLGLIGEWMEGRSITYNDDSYQVSAYPELTDGREITAIERQTTASLFALYDDGTADYQITMVARYSRKRG